MEQLMVLLWLVGGMLITPILFIGLDFWAGIRKAKERGDKIMSDKMQRTLQKMSRYYNAILAMMLVDCVHIAAFIFMHLYNGWTLYMFPLFTMLAVSFVAAVEIKSILEPANAKEGKELREVAALAKALLEHRQNPEELAKAVAEYLSKKDGYEKAETKDR